MSHWLSKTSHKPDTINGVAVKENAVPSSLYWPGAGTAMFQWLQLSHRQPLWPGWHADLNLGTCLVQCLPGSNQPLKSTGSSNPSGAAVQAGFVTWVRTTAEPSAGHHKLDTQSDSDMVQRDNLPGALLDLPLVWIFLDYTVALK